MSKIEKLSIRGIRSFGPEEEKKIEFYTPLTLILGQNGCGKTTIIESLKYITTGEVPPGCGRSGAFVHDPKIAKETTVRGQIKLLFKDRKGKQVVGSRSLEVTQKAKKLEFKTLDSTIAYKGADGKKTSISSKCVDFQAEMASFLGVTKPILENVIFCHQEECNWPLDEGKKVKNKFDAIFNATKYIKCLESIRKLRKDKKQRISHMAETLEALKLSKDQAANLRKQFKEVERDETAIKDDLVKLREEKAEARKKWKEMEEIESKLNSFKSDLQIAQNNLSTVRSTQAELRSSLAESYTCSDFELTQMIQDFEWNTKKQLEEQSRLEISNRNIECNIEKKKKEESSTLQRLGNLEADHRNHLTNIKKRDALLRELISKYNLPANYDIPEMNTITDEILLKFLEHIKKEREKTLKMKDEYESKDADMQKEIDILKSKEATLEHDIQICKEKCEQLSNEIRNSQLQLSKNENDVAAVDLENIRRSLNEISLALVAEEELVNSTLLTEEISKLRIEGRNVEGELKEIKSKISQMNKMVEHRSKLENFLIQKRNIEGKVLFLKRRNEDDFLTLFNNPIDANILNELNAKKIDIKRQTVDVNEKINKLNKKKMELDMKINNDNKQILNKGNSIADFEKKLQDIGQGSDLKMALNKSKEQITSLGKVKGDCESSLVMFRGFLGKLTAGDACPLCHRDFDQSYQVDMLIEEIEGKLKSLPQRLSLAVSDLKRHETVHESLLKMVPQKEIAEREIQEVEALRNINKERYLELEQVNSELETCLEHLDFLNIEEDCANRLQPDVIKVDEYTKNIQQFTNDINDIQAILGAYDETVTLEDCTRQEDELEQKAKSIREKIETKQNTIVTHNNKLQQLTNRKLALTTKQLEAKTKQQEIQTLRDKVKYLREQKVQVEEQLAESRQLVTPLKYQINEEYEKKHTLIKEKDNFIETMNKMLNTMSYEEKQANGVIKEVQKYIEQGKDEVLSECKRKVESLRMECQELETKKNYTRDEINKIEKEIANKKERKRGLESEKKIRDKEEEAKVLNKKIEALQETVDTYDSEKITREKEGFMREDTNVTTSIYKKEGRLQEILKQKQVVEANLNTKGMRNADKNYKEKVIEIKCMEIACNDLNKYFKALETAIMRFHSEKMSTINSIIRELWRTTYKGNDIDYVQIKTDETESQGIDRRRTYDYRVVMVKNDVEMDMRGRCSAGQKVLASLIIRMALAETFSLNCGILALDEPTTNLDRENIDALSLALLNIVNKRANQRNFQLIVITHDDDFLQKLTRADFIEYYHQVSRDVRGLSAINRKSVIHV